jgi:N-acetylglucosamine-6-phosphate deacetylase
MAHSFTANIAGKGLHRIHVADGTIAAVDALGPACDDRPHCSVGFIDLQINGCRGVSFGDPGLTPEAVVSVLDPIRKTGVTSFCPTLITDTLENLERSFRTLELTRREYPRFADSVPCYHLEGPFLSKGASKGAHDPERMRQPNWEEFLRLQRAANGRIGILTIAPELPGAMDFIRRASASGVAVAIGHTDCAPEDVFAAVEAGARLSTHLGNGCPEYMHRHRAPIWAQLAADGLDASLICDGFHLPRELVRTIVRVKGSEGCILVTDAVHVTGLPAGKYSLGSTPIELLADGRITTFTSPPCLGGSTLRMDDAITRFVNWSGLPLDEALRAATSNPARLLAPSDAVCRELRPGNPANLALWRWHEGRLQVEGVLVRGDWIPLEDAKEAAHCSNTAAPV